MDSGQSQTKPQQTEPKWGPVVGWLLAGAGLLWLPSLMASPVPSVPEPTPAPARAAESPGPRLVVKWHKSEVRGGLVFVTGVVKNEGELRAAGATIDFDLLDKQGRKVGTASDSVLGLEAGESWKFSALVPSHDEAGAYRFSRVEQY